MYTLYFDIGNTNIKIGIYNESIPVESFILPTGNTQTADSLGLLLDGLLRQAKIPVDAVTACVGASVVPSMNSTLKTACHRYLACPLLFAPEDIPIPLENHYERPAEVGADILVGAYGARCLFPQAPSLIIVDFGTATTFCCVTGQAFLGGLIAPGLFSSSVALSNQTAKLPRINLKTDDTVPKPCTSTATSLSHGFIFGFAAMAEGLCSRLAASLEGPVMVIGTGGFAPSIARISPCFDVIRPELLLEGLHLLYTEHAQKQVLSYQEL